MKILSITIKKQPKSNMYTLDYCYSDLSIMSRSDKLTPANKEELLNQLNELKRTYSNHLWLIGDVASFLQLMSQIGFNVDAITMIDLTIEINMLALTHQDYKKNHKHLEQSIRTYNFNTDLSCIYQQVNLISQILKTHNSITSSQQQSINQMINRTDYVKAMAKITYDDQGFPIDVIKLHTIFDNKDKLINIMQMQVNEIYGEIYVDDLNGHRKKIDHQKLKVFANKNNYEWDASLSGEYLYTDKQTLSELVKKYPELQLFYQYITTINSLRESKLLSIEKHGFIKQNLKLMVKINGNNHQEGSQIDLLTAPHWTRTLIKPKPSYSMIAINWDQLELGMAAGLSNDSTMIKIYKTIEDDVYIALAKMVGAAPKLATKHSHQEIRELFRKLHLSLMNDEDISLLLENISQLKKPLELKEISDIKFHQNDVYSQAKAIYDWYQSTFISYANWAKNIIPDARRNGFIQSLDGWTYFTNDTASNSQISHFPIKANCAALMRLTIQYLAKNNISIIRTDNNTVYFTVGINEQEHTIKLVQECMDRACYDLFNGNLILRTDVNIYDKSRDFSKDKGSIELIQLLNDYNTRQAA